MGGIETAFSTNHRKYQFSYSLDHLQNPLAGIVSTCISKKKNRNADLIKRPRPRSSFYPLFYPETFIRSLHIFAESIPFS